MKCFLPLTLSTLITAGLAGLIAWRQQVRIDDLRARVASSRHEPVKAAHEPVPAAKSAKSPSSPQATFETALSRSKSRSMLRTGQELVRYYQACPLSELRAAVGSFARGERSGSRTLEGLGVFIIGMSALAQRDIGAAVQLIGTMRGEMVVPAAIIVLNDWMLRDKKAALDWFHGMPGQKHKGMILTAATIFYGASNPQLVEELRNGISESDVVEQASSVAVEALAKADPQAALARLDEIMDDDRRAQAREEALILLSAKEPQKALQMMLEAAPDGQQIPDRLTAHVLLLFMARDRQAAAQWMAGQDAAVIARLLAAEPQLAAEASKDK